MSPAPTRTQLLRSLLRKLLVGEESECEKTAGGGVGVVLGELSGNEAMEPALRVQAAAGRRGFG